MTLLATAAARVFTLYAASILRPYLLDILLNLAINLSLMDQINSLSLYQDTFPLDPFF
jgi:hypothetical protein